MHLHQQGTDAINGPSDWQRNVTHLSTWTLNSPKSASLHGLTPPGDPQYRAKLRVTGTLLVHQ
jgi:hypothetical protein